MDTHYRWPQCDTSTECLHCKNNRLLSSKCFLSKTSSIHCFPHSKNYAKNDRVGTCRLKTGFKQVLLTCGWRGTSGPSCSKLMTLLVNDSLKFTSSDMQICWNFLLKKCAMQKLLTFFQQKISEYCTQNPLKQLMK